MSIPYKHFSISERENLLVMLAKKMKQSEIARELHRSRSTITRELKRNSIDGNYSSIKAEATYQARRTHCVRHRRLDDPKLAASVTACLQKYWSPEQIDGRLRLESGSTQISYATIYRAYNRGDIDVPKECFRRKRRPATPHHMEKRGRIHDYPSIHDRPTEADLAEQKGHWEGDTVRGAIHKGAIATFVDRCTGYTVGELMPDRKAATLNAAAEKAFADIPKKYRRTITVDHGNEFFSYKELEGTLETKIYFADPYAPWQRGLNENTNGLLRQYFPKKFDFHNITKEDFDAVLWTLNTRPRKALGYRCPFEVFWGQLLHFI